jgi:hypothetical protein
MFARVLQGALKPALVFIQRYFVLGVHVALNVWVVAPGEHKLQIGLDHGTNQ